MTISLSDIFMSKQTYEDLLNWGIEKDFAPLCRNIVDEQMKYILKYAEVCGIYGTNRSIILLYPDTHEVYQHNATRLYYDPFKSLS